MNYRRLKKLIIGLLAIVLVAGQIPSTYVYAQGKDETLSANTVEDGGAGIGGGDEGNGSNITIENACVAATGGTDAAAIGAARRGTSGTNININRNNSLVIENDEGTVTADITVNDDFMIPAGATVTIEEP